MRSAAGPLLCGLVMRKEADDTGSGGALRTLPVNLLLKGRLCLLVGAGHVAHRKLGNLLEHGARAVLLAPEVCSGVEALSGRPDVEVRIGGYDPAVLDETLPFLVYAATDDDALNRRIVADAADRGILASSVSSWREGDFISPSVLRWGRGQVSITTEGASCRQAKFMRLRLEGLLGGDRELLVVGVDLRSLSLAEFESVRPDARHEREIVAMLSQLAALEEFAVLATCNRLEVYAWTRWDESLMRTVLRVVGLEPFMDRVYVRTGTAVVEHAANVVAGHFSEVACETQITCQFKSAFRRAFEASVAGVHLQNLHDSVLALAKRIRSLHGDSDGGLPELVGGLIRRDTPPEGARVLVMGAGHLGREVATALARQPAVRLTWANRTLGNLPPEPTGPRLTLAQALSKLGAFDHVVTVLGAAEPVIRRGHLLGVRRPPKFIDLGLPRNVDPDVAEMEGVEVTGLSRFRSRVVDRDRLADLTRTVAASKGVVHA